MKSRTIFITMAAIVIGAALAAIWLGFGSLPAPTARMNDPQQRGVDSRNTVNPAYPTITGSGSPIIAGSGNNLNIHAERRPSASAVRRAPPIDGLQGEFNTVDKILDSLPSGNIAFNTPPAMNLSDTAIIQLKLDLATSIDELKRTIEAEGQKEGARIKVADRMEARLSGPNFAITQVTPEQQAISQGQVTEWKWEVKPTAEGRHHLHLTLSALLSVGGASTQRTIRTFDKFIEVDVTLPQRVSSFIQGNWQWLWAVLLAPFAGWGWNKWSGSKGGKP